jgi:glycosyltransferase involved in cell wall biosynthesis
VVKPRVSVIVNCYNGERYLREALDSVFAQTLTDFEIIFWDNASTDGSADIARGYDSRLRYFRSPENTSLGAARRAAVAEARGELLAFLDTDDRWYPHTLATLAGAIGPEMALCYGGIRKIDADGRPLGTVAPAARSGDLLGPLLRQFDVWIQALVLRRAALVRGGLNFDPAVTASEEYCLLIQLAAEAPGRSMPDILADYRIHAGALTNRSVDKWADERFYTLGRLLERHPEVQRTHTQALREAEARGRYYRARYFMAMGRPAQARQELRTTLGAGKTYAALYLLALMPPAAWNTIHAWKTRRAIG